MLRSVSNSDGLNGRDLKLSGATKGPPKLTTLRNLKSSIEPQDSGTGNIHNNKENDASSIMEDSSVDANRFSNGSMIDAGPYEDTSSSNKRQQHKHGSVKDENSIMTRDNSATVGNAWHFPNWRDDDKEQRYDSDEQELHDKQRIEEASHRAKYPSTPRSEMSQDMYRNSLAASEYFPSRPANNASKSQSNKIAPGSEDNKSHRMKKKFQFFSRKKNRDRDEKKYSITAADSELEDLKLEHATGERAQQLISSLMMGAPAINFLASGLLEDERGLARSPLLLTLIGFRIHDISRTIYTKNRKFKIDLEYGVSPQRLKWSVEKTAKDLLYLHSRFKFENWRKEVVRNKNSDLPRYPIPPLRMRRNLESHRQKHKSKHLKDHESSRSINNTDINDTTQEHHYADASSIITSRSLRNHLYQLRSRMSSLSSASSSSDENSPEQIRKKLQLNQDYINQVTNYLHELMKLVALKPQSNRLFQFFEISPISSLLSYETGFQGKQGVIHVGGTTKLQGWRVGHFRANDLKGMIDRRSEKWFLVRNSYVMYVSNINSTCPLEVFLVDFRFKIHHQNEDNKTNVKEDDESDYDDSSLVQKVLASTNELPASNILNKVFKHLKIVLENSERKLVLIPKSYNEQKLWLKSLSEMKASTIWSTPNRFESFAPVRSNCFAQWFVDARDYFWAVSSALEMAKDVIFIHDWWLSPELYLRRPAHGNQQWRIDRILQRKAQQGVKIFVIVYRNVGTTVATDSLYTKHSILSLNEDNIHVIRSPNQLLQNTYFWAHHEKLCIIDQTVAFLGGIDLCYGRYDTPDHVIVDDSEMDFKHLNSDYPYATEELIKFQTFPGKDYSNPRVKDFFELDKPYESMYNRSITPRMPWHDVHMFTAGKIARDLSRHFIQRWNYLIRQKRPSRFTPLLTPPPDLTDEEVKQMGLEGTCEIQLLRSSGNWSLGLKEHEQSIQNAYLRLIETSEHFVYIENQFFVTSCVVDGNEIQNRIGDALVDRIIRAYNEGTNWKAIIVIPLMPGFESQVDEPEGSSVRVIMQCQYMSISRGPTSIFSKLMKYGIDPDEYIQFYSLRKWGRIGPDRTLVTEQLYVHAKTMIVDDRAAIIGSANINERSMRGIRDSEVAAIVRDQNVIKSKMNGEEFLAGRFSHTLRMRLMREHLGVNVDILDIVERRFAKFEEFAKTPKGLSAATSSFKNRDNLILSAMVELASRDVLKETEGTSRWRNYQKMTNKKDSAGIPLFDEIAEEKEDNVPPMTLPISFSNRTGTNEANRGIRDRKKHSYDARVQHNELHRQDVFGEGIDKYKTKLAKRVRLNSNRFLKELANKSMLKSPGEAFLPDYDNVKEFLELNDHGMVDEMDEESENIISERNKERWILLKKVSYLQRVAYKAKEQADEESKKRTAAGFEPSFAHQVSMHRPSSTPKKNMEGISDTNNANIVSSVGINETPSVSAPLDPSKEAGSEGLNSSTVNNNSSDKKHSELGSTEVVSNDIPVATLDEKTARELIDSIKSRGDERTASFIDPYAFEDPLDDEFYEDMWFETARANTEIYRTIFHTQPDDEVLTWKDYKHSSKLNRAFVKSQKEEAKRRKRNKFFDGSMSDVSDIMSEGSDNSEEYRVKYQNTKNRINVDGLDQVGLLGEAPPSGSSSEIFEQNDTKNDRKAKIWEDNEKSAIPEHPDENEYSTITEKEKDPVPDSSEYHLASNGIKEGTPSSALKPEASIDMIKSSAPSTENGVHRNGYDSSLPKKRKGRSRVLVSRRRILGEKIFDHDSAERILSEIQGHLVLFPPNWLSRELESGNWFYNTDRIPPIDIYD